MLAIRLVCVVSAGRQSGTGRLLLPLPSRPFHAYSLIHGRPASDDDDDLAAVATRPATFAYDEATAILAGGDALQGRWRLSVAAQAQDLKPGEARFLRMIRPASLRRRGSTGDGRRAGVSILGRRSFVVLRSWTCPRIEQECTHTKPVSLHSAPACSLAPWPGEQVDESSSRRLSRYAHCIGLAFPGSDDIIRYRKLDSHGVLSKQQGADASPLHICS